MKTAVSIPDSLFRAAEQLARELGISRSELYQSAIHEYIAKRDDAEITRRLNEVYGKESSELDPVLHRMQMEALPKEDW